MKKLLLLLSWCFMMSSCLSLPESKPSYNCSTFDFTPFLERGIFVSKSLSVPFDYIALSNISVTAKHGIKNGKVDEPDFAIVYDKLIDELNKQGANGIIGFELITQDVPDTKVFLPEYKLGYITVSGMAIRSDKRKIPVLTTKSLHKDKAENEKHLNINGIECNIVDIRESGAIIETYSELNVDQIREVIDKFKLKNKPIQLYLPNNNKAYAGITDNGYIINYKTKEFIKF